jgi:hypothetical protein
MSYVKRPAVAQDPMPPFRAIYSQLTNLVRDAASRAIARLARGNAVQTVDKLNELVDEYNRIGDAIDGGVVAYNTNIAADDYADAYRMGGVSFGRWIEEMKRRMYRLRMRLLAAWR